MTSPRFTASTLYHCGLLLMVAALFLWTRVNPSTTDRIYFFGDGTLIVALANEMLRTGDWTADTGRIADAVVVQKEWEGFSTDTPQPGGHYFNLSGYVVLLTLVSQVFQWLGLDTVSLPAVARILNLILQAGTLVLVYLTGKRLGSRELGLGSALFFVFLPLSVTEAQYERPESWLAFLGAVMLYASLWFTERAKLSLCAMGLALGLSAAVKPSQLFLLLLPGFLILQHVIGSAHASLTVRLRESIGLGIVLLASLVLAFCINVPFVLDHWRDYLDEVARIDQFFNVPSPLYSAYEEGYVAQAKFIASFFWKTMGIPWCLLVLTGMLLCLAWRPSSLNLPAHFRASLCIPILFLFIFLSGKENFFERFFTATESMICVLGALALYFVREQLSQRLGKRIAVITMPILIGGVLLQSALLDYRFIEKHIRHNGFQARLDFQERLLRDFTGFWIKNVHITYSFINKLPEKPPKAPRIYHIEDYNQAWTDVHLEHLKASGYIQIATYCSDFHSLPPGNHTVYHASAKNHYLVRKDEWPPERQRDYFVTNCR